MSAGTSAVGAISSYHGERARQFYGGLASRAPEDRADYDARWNRAPPRASQFISERRRSSRNQAGGEGGGLTKTLVETLETTKAVWWCAACEAAVEITSEKNQVVCPTCRARHLEAPRRPREGLLPAR